MLVDVIVELEVVEAGEGRTVVAPGEDPVEQGEVEQVS